MSYIVEELSEKLDCVFTKLNIAAGLVRYSLLGEDDIRLDVYTVTFKHHSDAAYVAWNVLENIPEDYFDNKYMNMLDDMVRDGHTNAIILESDALYKLLCVVEALEENKTINEWQSSSEAISLFDQYHNVSKHKDISWSQKYHAIRHIDQWLSDAAKDILNDIVGILADTCTEDVSIQFEPIDYPYMTRVNIPDSMATTKLIQRVMQHDKFSEFDKALAMSLEQLTTEVPTQDTGFIISLNNRGTMTFRDILVDLYGEPEPTL